IVISARRWASPNRQRHLSGEPQERKSASFKLSRRGAPTDSGARNKSSHHRGTENTEVSQRNQPDFSVKPLCSLCLCGSFSKRLHAKIHWRTPASGLLASAGFAVSANGFSVVFAPGAKIADTSNMPAPTTRQQSATLKTGHSIL